MVNRSRLLLACLFLLVAHRALEGAFFPTGVEPFRWGWLAVSSVLGLVLGDAFLFRAYVLIGPRLAMLLMATVPIFSALFGWLLFGEAVTNLELIGITPVSYTHLDVYKRQARASSHCAHAGPWHFGQCRVRHEL